MKLFQSRGGKIALLSSTVLLVAFAAYSLYRLFGGSPESQILNQRWLVCTETRKAYQVDLSTITEWPAYSPFSKKNTGQPAELCYWNADGTIRKEPTPVLLNKYVGESSPTFCPDCGRLVVERNPEASPGSRPPPMRAEYEARRWH